MNKEIQKLTFNELINRCKELINAEYDFPSFSAFYYTDNGCDGSKKKPYKLKILWITPLCPKPNENGKFTLSLEQKRIFKNMLLETFNKENIYLL